MQLVWPSCPSVNRVAHERLAAAPVGGRCRSGLLPIRLRRGKELARFSGAAAAPQLPDWLDQSLAGQREAS